MNNNTNVSESVLGWSYLLFHIFLLPPLLRWANEQLPTSLSDSWIALIAYGLSFLFMLLILHKFIASAGNNMAKESPKWLRFLALGFCIYYTSNSLMDMFMEGWCPAYANIADSTLVTLMKLDFLPMVIGAIFLVPFVEELMFRGLVFRTLYNQNKTLGYVIATVIYAFMHIIGYIDDYEPLALFLFFLQFIPAGFTLAWTYVNSDNIIAPIALHIIINAMGVCMW